MTRVERVERALVRHAMLSLEQFETHRDDVTFLKALAVSVAGRTIEWAMALRREREAARRRRVGRGRT